MIEVVVGCPVRERDWILPDWFDHVAAACTQARVKWAVAFLTGEDQDRGLLDKLIAMHGVPSSVLPVPEPPLPPPSGKGPLVNRWSKRRVEHMVELRNQLLELVKTFGAPWFWSVDSDILVHPDALRFALDLAQRRGFDAVGSCTWMAHNAKTANYGMFHHQGGFIRPTPEPGAQIKVDVIMAIKLMNRVALNVPYAYHRKGEDVGWSLNARERGVKLGWDSRSTSKHIMAPEHLGRPDKRYDW